MVNYKRIGVLFKVINYDLFNWIKKRSVEEDVSMSVFIIRSLKKIRKDEERDDGDEERL